MEFSMMYCTHCLKKLVQHQLMIRKNGGVYFFLPVMDSYQRAFYVYLHMVEERLQELCALGERQSVDLLPLVEILHVEEGWWPDETRMKEIRDFYAAATNHGRHDVRVAA